MALSIKSDEADRLARELSAVTGESLTAAVTNSLRERLARQRMVAEPGPGAELLAIGGRFRAELGGDTRTADEIIGYDEYGAPA
ncbi:MAG: type II toxin-antitoxin system VapB family antitoxin [Acidimicrobiales bacterium]